MFSTTTLVLVSSIFLIGRASAGPLYLNALPDLFLSQAARALRSNIAFTESDPSSEFDGSDVTLNAKNLGASSVIVKPITTRSIASILGKPSGDEFNSVSLYFRPLGGTWQIAIDAEGSPGTGAPDQSVDSSNPSLVLNSNPDITRTKVAYRPSVPYYQSTSDPDVFYQVWRNTFTALDLQLRTGVDYKFAVWGTSLDPDLDTLFGYWFNSYSNAFLSGAREDDKSGTYLRRDATQLSAPCFVEDPAADGTWDKGANMNIEIDARTILASDVGRRSARNRIAFAKSSQSDGAGSGASSKVTTWCRQEIAKPS